MPTTTVKKKAQTETQEPTVNELSPGQKVRLATRAFRLSFSDVGTQRQLNDATKAEVATKHNVVTDRLNLSKRLIDAKHPAIKQKNKAKATLIAYYEARTLPFPESGIRLLILRCALDKSIAPEDVQARASAETNDFLGVIRNLIADFYESIEQMQGQWQDVIAQARLELGDLFDEADYPTDIRQTIGCRFEPCNIELPDYYKHVSPQEYQEACQLVAQKFELAAELQKQFVAKWMQESVEQLVSSVVGFHKGEQKAFKNSVIQNVFDAFEEFRNKTRVFDIGKSTDLEKTIDRIISLMSKDSTGNAISPDTVAEELRFDSGYRQNLTTQLSALGESLAAQLQNVSRRRLMK